VPQALHTQQAPVAAIQDTNTFQFVVDRRLPSMKDPLLKTFGQVATQPAQQTPALQVVASTWDATTRGVATLSGLTEKYQAAVQYPDNVLGKTLQQVARMLSSDIGTRIVYLQLGGFDTHANEKPQHATLMTQLGDSLAAFQRDLEAHGQAEQVLTLTISEYRERSWKGRLGYRMIRNPLVNWNYTTAPEKVSGERRIEWPRGRTLGEAGAACRHPGGVRTFRVGSPAAARQAGGPGAGRGDAGRGDGAVRPAGGRAAHARAPVRAARRRG